MPVFIPYTDSTSLPAIGAGFEQAVLDFKLEAETTDAFQRAKDVAAFANHLGGTLLVGAKEANGVVAAYVPLTFAVATQVQDGFSQAVSQRCSPRPLIDFARVPSGAGVVL